MCTPVRNTWPVAPVPRAAFRRAPTLGFRRTEFYKHTRAARPVAVLSEGNNRNVCTAPVLSPIEIPDGYDVLITIHWSGHPDLDIRVECLGRSVGWSVGTGDSVLAWPSGDNTEGGPENAYISRAAAQSLGILKPDQPLTFGIGSGWYSPRQAEPGTAATATVSSLDGRTTSFPLSPGLQGTGVSTVEKTVTIPLTGSFIVT